jgi:hypothetical protein
MALLRDGDAGGEAEGLEAQAAGHGQPRLHRLAKNAKANSFGLQLRCHGQPVSARSNHCHFDWLHFLGTSFSIPAFARVAVANSRGRTKMFLP